MKRNLLVTVVVVFGILLIVFTMFPGSIFADIAVGAATVGGGFAIFYQLHRENIITQGQFIFELNQSFISDDDISEIADGLFEGKEIKVEHRQEIMQYLSFFEVLYLLLDRKALDLSAVDYLFRRKFFSAVMNKQIQDIELVAHDRSYQNIYKLDKLWVEHLNRIGEIDHIAEYGVILRLVNPKNYDQLSQNA